MLWWKEFPGDRQPLKKAVSSLSRDCFLPARSSQSSLIERIGSDPLFESWGSKFIAVFMVG